MAYALICTTSQPLIVWVRASGNIPNQTPGYWNTVVAEPGTIINIIVYDPDSDYEAPINTRIAEVPEDAKIGDTGY